MADMLASTLGEDVKAHLPPHTRGVLSHTVPKERGRCWCDEHSAQGAQSDVMTGMDGGGEEREQLTESDPSKRP